MTSKPITTIVTLIICYRSSGGEITQRIVFVTSCDDYQLNGTCQLRGMPRTFVYDRIISCFNRDTGEVISDVYQHLRATYRGSPLYTLELLHRNHYEALQILLYVAKADGQIRADERRVILAACKVISGDLRITDDLARHLLDSINPPSLRTFKGAVGKVLKRGNDAAMRRLFIASRTMVNTQKTITATEQEALDYMRKRFQLQAEL